MAPVTPRTWSYLSTSLHTFPPPPFPPKARLGRGSQKSPFSLPPPLVFVGFHPQVFPLPSLIIQSISNAHLDERRDEKKGGETLHALINASRSSFALERGKNRRKKKKKRGGTGSDTGNRFPFWWTEGGQVNAT